MTKSLALKDGADLECIGRKGNGDRRPWLRLRVLVDIEKGQDEVELGVKMMIPPNRHPNCNTNPKNQPSSGLPKEPVLESAELITLQIDRSVLCGLPSTENLKGFGQKRHCNRTPD
ncbi:hypothetical protein TNCV_4137261 [Trichonephila clavipes]|nr:hypothetical protein TNCV_4137261 [Trichonephila clavipes]